MKDLGHGFGTFIKINESTEIKNQFLLSIGENYLVFTLGLEEETLLNEHVSFDDNNNLINIKIFTNNVRHGKLSFSPKQSPFIIGRSPECQVIIDDSLLSRFHCSVEFRNDKWYIYDGVKNSDGKIKNSTNGSWKYAFEDTEIVDGLTFKANHNLFICSFEN